MKYLYSILLIVTVFFALPLVIDYSSSLASHAYVYFKTSGVSEKDEPQKARDYPSSYDKTQYSEAHSPTK